PGPLPAPLRGCERCGQLGLAQPPGTPGRCARRPERRGFCLASPKTRPAAAPAGKAVRRVRGGRRRGARLRGLRVSRPAGQPGEGAVTSPRQGFRGRTNGAGVLAARAGRGGTSEPPSLCSRPSCGCQDIARPGTSPEQLSSSICASLLPVLRGCARVLPPPGHPEPAAAPSGLAGSLWEEGAGRRGASPLQSPGGGGAAGLPAQSRALPPAGGEDVRQRARAPAVPLREGAGEPGAAGGGDPADGLPPALPRQLPQDAALPAAHGRPAALRLPPLHRHHGEPPPPRGSCPGLPVPCRAAGFPAEAKAGRPGGEADARGPRWLLAARGSDAALLQAAARHHCRYLVNLHVLQFLRAGGDPQWLRGLDFIPPKLRNLNEINKILAHRPWLITKEHIEKLLKISEWSWSLAELVHAVVLLAHCHALASFVFGCGCEQEEGPGGRGSLKPSPPGNQCFCEAATGNGCSQELLRINRKRSLDSCMELDSLRERIQRIHVETEGREETRLLLPDREEDTDGEVTGAANLACYMQDPDFGYQDFARRDEDQTQVFRVQDYSWEDHGFSLVNRLYSDIGHLLDEKFRMVGGLQSSAMAKRQGCEPSVFKRGIWNYIHCMFGIRYDDYDYAEVNHLLERMLKVYIKTVTCYPEKTNPEMFDRFWKQFKHSEKVHVNLLILEARMQAELLYALQAITQYMVS
uniref:Sestrin 3 n=1 Tax=Anser brachyrhynchus TaxID=132585 RepID=A0A8B9CN72_9AVES